MFLFLSLSAFAQENEQLQEKSAVYRDLMNYIPKSLQHFEDSVENDSIKPRIVSIQQIWMFNDLVHTEDERKWMDQTIRHIAMQLFIDGKKVLLRSVGGYLGCPDKSVDTIQLNGIDITELQLCESCNDIDKNQRFIETFNTKMHQLMKIDPPTEKTELFYGQYKGFDEHKRPIKLILKKDRSFQYRKYPEIGHGGYYTDGFWQHRNDTLILNSRALKGLDSISVALQSGKWVEFNDAKWILKRSKLKSLDYKKLKLKKEEP